MKGFLQALSIGAPTFLSICLFLRLRPHRVDLQPGQGMFDGESQLWQVNVFSRNNYDPRGRWLLRWLIGAMLLQAVCYFVAMVLFLRVG